MDVDIERSIIARAPLDYTFLLRGEECAVTEKADTSDVKH